MVRSIRFWPEPDLFCSRVLINKGVLKSVKKLTYDTLELVVKCEDGCKPLNAAAGQYATLHTPGISKPRSYSFAKAPEDEADNEYTFFVRLVPGGEFSGWLFGGDRVGAPMTISGPMGKVQLDLSNAPMVCIAGGSGMSAIKAILEHACNLQVERDAYFFYGARTQNDLYCLDEINHIKKRWNGKFNSSGNGSFSGYQRVEPAHTSGLYYNTLYIDDKECIRCYACVEACPVQAISPQYDKKPNTLRRVTA
jgi:toluene methyl-monooxygenase electron transfer component